MAIYLHPKPHFVFCTSPTLFRFRHYLYEQKLLSLLWKIDGKDLIVTSGSVHDNVGMSHSSTSESRPKVSLERAG